MLASYVCRVQGFIDLWVSTLQNNNFDYPKLDDASEEWVVHRRANIGSNPKLQKTLVRNESSPKDASHKNVAIHSIIKRIIGFKMSVPTEFSRTSYAVAFMSIPSALRVLAPW